MHNENLKMTSDTVDCFSLAPLNSTSEILACRERVGLPAADDFIVMHATNSLPSN
jgi:hypothetical protein